MIQLLNLSHSYAAQFLIVRIENLQPISFNFKLNFHILNFRLSLAWHKNIDEPFQIAK